jgi:predicted O-methyltransferase YrrM
MSTVPDPSGIMALSTAYWGSQTLLTANRLQLFDVLEDNPVSAAELSARVELDARAAELLLNACVALGLCRKTGDEYSNSDSSATFLVSSSPAYIGNAIRYSDDLYSTWGELEQATRSGTPPKRAEEYLGENDEQTRHFVYGMHNRAMAIGRALTGMVDLSGRKKMLDVGGGPGTYSALLTERFPELQADVLELEGVAAIARQILQESGADERVTMIDGDYHTSNFGTGYDVVLMSGMFHRETDENCQALIKKAHTCLDPGGLLVINDVFADAGGTGPEFAALFGLNMMLTAPDGGVHADEDVATWMRDAGFEQLQRSAFPPPMPHRIVSGSKA